MHNFNLAFIAKLGWNLLSNSNCLWVKQLLSKYIKYEDFLFSPLPSTTSWLWKGIQKIKPIISAGACLRVSHFSSSIFGFPQFPPSGLGPNIRSTGICPLFRLWISLTLSVLAGRPLQSMLCLILYRLMKFLSFVPLLTLVPNLFGLLLLQDIWPLLRPVVSLLPTPVPLPVLFPPFFWKSIWKLNLNDRLKLFLWKIAWNILPTMERLGQLFPISDTHCPLCKVADDSLSHLFFECFFARVVWHHSFWPLDSTTFPFSLMADWIASIISPGHSLGILLKDQHKFQFFSSVACDILCFYRNKALHEGLTFDARSVSLHINKISFEHFQAWHSSSQVLLEKWTPSPLNWVKINFDTAIRDSFSAQAVVCRDSRGQVLHLSSQISLPCSPNVGEAWPAQLACFIASSLSYDMFILEGDSEVVVHALNNPNSVRDWRISSVILNSLDSIPFTSVWEVRKIKRSANFYGHSAARWAAARSHSDSISFSFIPSLFSSPSSGENPLFVCLL